jgi:hypothetical protein
MQRVPGTFPLPQGSGGINLRTPIRGRVQTPDPSGLRAPTPQPVAAPVNTFVRPQAPDEDNRLASLARSLADFNPVLNGFLSDRAPDPEDQAAAAQQFLQNNDPEAVEQMLRDGNVPVALQNVAAMGIYGEDFAHRMGRGLVEQFNTNFDPATMNPQALLDEALAGIPPELVGDRTFMEAFTGAFEPYRQTIFENSSERVTEQVLMERQQTIYGAWMGRIDSALINGTSVLDSVYSIFSDIPANRDFLNLHPREQQGILMQMADVLFARGDYDAVQALLSSLRNDGAYQGSLMSDAQFGQTATVLWQRAEEQRVRAGQAQTHQAAVTQLGVQVDQFIQTGNIMGVQDAVIPGPDGQSMTISRNELLDMASDRMLDQVRSVTQQGQLNPQQAFQYEFQMFVTNGLEHPVWFEQMESGYTTLSSSAVTGQQLPPGAVQAFETFRELNASAPGYLSSHLGSEATTFYDAAEALIQFGAATTPEQALQMTQHAFAGMRSNDPATMADYRTISTAVDNVLSDSGPWWGQGATNYSRVREDLVSYATVLARNGVKPEDALERAREAYPRFHTNVLGTFIRNDGQMLTLGGDFTSLMEQHVKELMDSGDTAFNEYDLGAVTISEFSRGAGAYVLVDAATRIPIISDVSGQPYYISFDDLHQLNIRNRQAAANNAAANQTQPSQENFDWQGTGP